jgi:type IV secretion system protein VirB11
MAYSLDDFEAQGMLSASQRVCLEGIVQRRQTLAISGPVRSGKTSLLNALLGTLAGTDKSIFVVEDDPEVICHADNVAAEHTLDGVHGQPQTTMRDLVRYALRHSPDLLVVGEVRDGAALEALKGFQAGLQGLMTVHAQSALGTLRRLEQLILEVSLMPQREVIAEAINAVAHMVRLPHGWRCAQILAVEGLDGEQYLTQPLA